MSVTVNHGSNGSNGSKIRIRVISIVLGVMGPKNSTGEVKAHRHVMGEDGKRHRTMPEAHRPKNVKPKQPKEPKTDRRK